jgi:adenylate cyclase
MTMEENIAILIADLSGYTALTETHGASSAADLIDKYMEIVDDCLVGDCKLKERTGDEVMIISRSADFLLSTAAKIITQTSKQENFLQVHGGLHYGTVLKRSNSYFGSAINLTARIAAKANPGTFWCSKDFINALDDKSTCSFQSKGKQKFKNINEEKEVAELQIDNPNNFLVDPVCRMLIVDKEIALEHPKKTGIFFCSQHCLNHYNTHQSSYSTIDNYMIDSLQSL